MGNGSPRRVLWWHFHPLGRYLISRRFSTEPSRSKHLQSPLELPDMMEVNFYYSSNQQSRE